MDDDGLNMRNWGYYETPSYKAPLNLQLMTNMADRDTKHFLPGRDPNIMVSNHGAFHPRDCMVSDASIPMNYMREGWMGQRDKFLNMLHVNPHYPMLPETSGAHSLHILQPPNSSRDERVPRIDERVPRIDEKPARIDERSTGIEESSVNKVVQSKKRQGGGASKIPKPKKARKPKENSGNGALRLKPAKKSLDVVINGIDMDISGIPIPVCSCTGTPQQCYRWGCGGWQSACCTTNVSVYPLPMSTKRRGARIAGRKMSQGAFKKVLEKLAAEGYNFGNPIDLRTHWARHGTNKFVTIR